MAGILVIDDDEMVRITLRAVLESAGHEVAVAKDGPEGLRMLQDRRADLVITDLIMPDKSGTEIIVEIRHDHPGVKIAAISGGARVGSLDLLSVAKALGADRVLTKPVDNDELFACVEACLAG